MRLSWGRLARVLEGPRGPADGRGRAGPVPAPHGPHGASHEAKHDMPSSLSADAAGNPVYSRRLPRTSVASWITAITSSPAKARVIAIIAKDRDQAKVIKSYIVGFMREIPAFAGMIEDELAETVRLSNGVVVEVHTASIGAPRGRAFLAVLCDETAFWPMGKSMNPDIEVIKAVRPGLATIPYSLFLIASSPYAKRGDGGAWERTTKPSWWGRPILVKPLSIEAHLRGRLMSRLGCGRCADRRGYRAMSPMIRTRPGPQ